MFGRANPAKTADFPSSSIIDSMLASERSRANLFTSIIEPVNI